MGNFVEGNTAYLRSLTYRNQAHREACQALDINALAELVRKTTVLKVGRKYISVGSSSGRIDGQYEKDTGKEKTQYSPSYVLYASWEEAMSDIRAEHLWFAFRSRINSIAAPSRFNPNSVRSAVEMPKLEMAAKLLGLDIPWEPSPLYYNAHLVQASHEHRHGYDVNSCVAASQALAKKTVVLMKEEQFDYDPDCEDEIFDYSIEKVAIDLNQMEPCSEEECAKAKEDATTLANIFPDDLEKTYITGSARLNPEQVTFEHEIMWNDNQLEFYIPIYFDPDAVFGTNVCTEENDDYVNVYAIYDLEKEEAKDELIVYLCRGDGSEDDYRYKLTEEETKWIKEKMAKYCLSVCMSLEAFRQWYLEKKENA